MSASKKTPQSPRDATLVSFTVKLPKRWIEDMETMAAKETGAAKADIFRRALAIGLDELKKSRTPYLHYCLRSAPSTSKIDLTPISVVEDTAPISISDVRIAPATSTRRSPR